MLSHNALMSTFTEGAPISNSSSALSCPSRREFWGIRNTASCLYEESSYMFVAYALYLTQEFLLFWLHEILSTVIIFLAVEISWPYSRF